MRIKQEDTGNLVEVGRLIGGLIGLCVEELGRGEATILLDSNEVATLITALQACLSEGK